MVFLYLNSDQMGKGDEDLGRKLLEVYLEKLANSDEKVDLIGFVNSGIKLTTKGSRVIGSLKKLEEKGTRMSSCGTCLDHYNKRDELMIGEIGSMDQTLQIMAQATKIIQL